MKTTIEGWLTRDYGPITASDLKLGKLKVWPKYPYRDKVGLFWMPNFPQDVEILELPAKYYQELSWQDEPRKVTITIEDSVEVEQAEYSYLEKFQPIYHCGKKPTWKVGDTLAYYALTTDEEGECIYGTVAEVHFDEEHKDWRYQLKDYPHWMDDGVIYEEELVCSEAYKV